MKKFRTLGLLFVILCTLSLAGCKPVVTITFPQNGDTFALGVEITFSGEATDFLSGAVPEALLVWSIDDEEVATGSTFTKSDLATGTHTLKLSVTDPHGMGTGSAQITITVGSGGATTTTTAATTTMAPTTTTTTADIMPPELALQCVDYGVPNDPSDDVCFSDVVNVTSVDLCVYHRSVQTLNVSLYKPSDDPLKSNYDAVDVHIEPFTGPGTYTTDPEGKVLVGLHGAGAEAHHGGDTSGDDSTYDNCTIKVTSTNLNTIVIPQGTEQKGWVDIEVTCPQVGCAGVGIIECQVSPSTWRVRVNQCNASE